MIQPPSQPEPSLQIRKPCPKSWEELAGTGKQRFCSQCSLHVHDGAQLTRGEAQSLVAGASSRVCMRLQYDASGAPVFRDTAGRVPAIPKPPRSFVERAARWGLSAAASVLAACQGDVPVPPVEDPAAQPAGSVQPAEMGRVVVHELGDVRIVPEPPPVLERLGEMVAVPQEPPASPTPPPDVDRER